MSGKIDLNLFKKKFIEKLVNSKESDIIIREINTRYLPHFYIDIEGLIRVGGMNNGFTDFKFTYRTNGKELLDE